MARKAARQRRLARGAKGLGDPANRLWIGGGVIFLVEAGDTRGQAEMIVPQAHIPAMMNLELSDAETETLTQEFAGIVDNARFPLSPRIQTLRAVLARLRPEPVLRPAASPELRVYAAPSRGSHPVG